MSILFFEEGLAKNKDAEKERKFCHHDMNHFLDVGRLMYIFSDGAWICPWKSRDLCGGITS